MQLGKRGISEEFINNLKRQFEKTKNVRIKILKNSVEGRNEIKATSNKILGMLGDNYKAKIIGYTIAIKRGGKRK